LVTKDIQNNIIQYLKNCQFRQFCDDYFAEEFSWTICGTSLLSGHYNDKEDFFSKVINRLNNHILPGWTMDIKANYTVNNVFIIEMVGSARTKSEKDYNNEYCWILKFNDNSKITNLTAYYDSLLVNKILNENL